MRCGLSILILTLLVQAGSDSTFSQTMYTKNIDKDSESQQVQQSINVNAATTKQNGKILVQDNSAFAFNLYKQLRTSKGNLSFSPYGISTAMALVHAGARGDTEKQITQTLCFTLEKNNLHQEFAGLQDRLNQIQQAGDIKLFIANSLWPQKDYELLDEFLLLAGKYYGISITPVDYEQAKDITARTINAWIESKTENKIKDLIHPKELSELTRFILANTIYFKGDWENQFNPDFTQNKPFYVLPNKFVKTPMMSQLEYVKYAQLKTLQIVQIPYLGNDISMLILLPNKRDGLEQIEQSLSVDNLDFWRQRLKDGRVNIILPKFTMTCTYDLRKAFEDMGMVDAFKYPIADFSGMDGSRELCIGLIKHKVLVNVNEAGTEAAAATVVMMEAGYSPPQSLPVFRADHPFLFIIQENKTGCILFIGRVINPNGTTQN